MEFVSSYVSRAPDKQGYVVYSEEENTVWSTLYKRQMEVLPGRACDEYLRGLELLELKQDSIPQIPEVNQCLNDLTGWGVEPVKALISAREFFELLAQRLFPAATFIRREEELDYIKEPDIFHELFGHCPMLTNPVFADFVQDYAQKVLTMDEKDWPLMQRLFWFTVEFGLIQTTQGLRVYGGGILSSIGETVYSVESDIPIRVLFNPLVAFRTPYRIDMLQPVYFVIQNYQQLYDFIHSDVDNILKKVRELGEFPPTFPVEGENPSIHIRVC
jgi:phenylalanine-4-hydroxylase